MEPRRYEVILVDKTHGVVEQIMLKSTLTGIETRILTKYGDDVELRKIEQVEQLNGVYDLTEDDKPNQTLKIVSETEAIIDLQRRISDLEELLTLYDPDRDESHLDDNQK